jgi:hypothetical protein
MTDIDTVTPMRRTKTLIALAATAATAALFAGPSAALGSAGLTSAGALSSPTATTSSEEQIRYLPSGRKPVKLRIAYRGVCTVDCNVIARTTLVLPGPNIGPVTVSGAFDANEIFEAFIKLNGPALQALKQNRRAARLRTRITGIDLSNGVRDIDRRTFRFKRG